MTDNIGSQPNRKLGRDWKVMENGAVGNVTLSVPSASLPASLTHLMVYADPGNTHVGAIYYPLTTVGSDRRVQVDLVSGRYFSFVSYDNDRDGIDDGTDLDDDNDGIPDTAEGGDLLDTDGDGIPNRFDLDSDNDGIFDVVEALSGQPHYNGVLNGPVTAFEIPTSVDADANNVVDHIIRDSDSDGTIDSMELDSDDDGCRDVIEAGYTDQNNDGELGPIPLTVDGSGRVTSGGPSRILMRIQGANQVRLAFSRSEMVRFLHSHILDRFSDLPGWRRSSRTFWDDQVATRP